MVQTTRALKIQNSNPNQPETSPNLAQDSALVLHAVNDLEELNAHIGIILTGIDEPVIRDTLCQAQEDISSIIKEIAAPPIHEITKQKDKLRRERLRFLDGFINAFSKRVTLSATQGIPRGSIMECQLYLALAVCKRSRYRLEELRNRHMVLMDVVGYFIKFQEVLNMFVMFIKTIEEDACLTSMTYQ